MTSFHICVPITRAIEELKKGNNLFYPATETEALKALLKSQSQGKKYYTGCGRENTDGRCRGHKDKRLNK